METHQEWLSGWEYNFAQSAEDCWRALVVLGADSGVVQKWFENAPIPERSASHLSQWWTDPQSDPRTDPRLKTDPRFLAKR